MYYYQQHEGKRFLCLPMNVIHSNNKAMICLNEIVSIEPYDEDSSTITLSTGKEIVVFEKVSKIFDFLLNLKERS